MSLMKRVYYAEAGVTSGWGYAWVKIPQVGTHDSEEKLRKEVAKHRATTQALSDWRMRISLIPNE